MLQHKTYQGCDMLLESENGNLDLLDVLTMAVPTFHSLMKGKNVIAIADLEQYRIYVPGEDMDHKLRAGSKLIEGSVMHRVIVENNKVVIRADSKVFGFPYIARAIPLHNELGKVIGGFIFCERVDRQDELLSISEQLVNITNTVGNLLEKLTQSAEALFSSSDDLKTLADKSFREVVHTYDDLNLIRHVNGDIKILGFNAALEAARAGDNGRGFRVVSEEMRKLADNSNISLQKIECALKDTKDISETVIHEASNLEENVKHQSESIATIYGMMQEIQAITDKLNKSAEAVVGDNS